MSRGEETLRISGRSPPRFPGASHVLNGFRYQLMHSLAAWLDLRNGEELWLEVSEDFSILSSEAVEDVQVKASRAAAGPTAYSLQSDDVQNALRRFWDRAASPDGSKFRLTFIANGGAARARNHEFPDKVPGLEYWHKAAIDADTAPIRAALSTIFADEPIGTWIASNPSDDEFRERLLRRVQWALNAAPIEVIADQLRDQVASFCLTKKLPAIVANAGWRSLLDHVFETASQVEPDQRVLDRLQLHRTVEEAASGFALAQVMSEAGVAPRDITAHSVLVNELGEDLEIAARRNETLREILIGTRGEPVIWIYGTHGVGKSTLARLLAHEIGGRWLTLDLQPVQKDAVGSLAAWREITHAITIDGVPDGLVLDDFAEAAPDALRGRLAELVASLKTRGGRVIITSPQEPAPARLSELGATTNAAVQAPYFTEQDVIDLVGASDAPRDDMIRAWAVFIRVSASGGHPLLTAAKVSSLRARSWPLAGLTEDFGQGPSKAVRATRDEARQLLLRELSALDGARSLDAGNVLRRIACVFDRVDDDLARKLSLADPSITTAGDALAVLRGAWLEMLPGGDFRVSPLLGDIIGDVAPADADKWRRLAAEHWLSAGTLNERTLPLCFWNAFWGKHVLVLHKLCDVIQSLPRQVLRGAAALLSPMTMLVTDRSFYPDDPMLGANLRLLQFVVANAIEDEALAGRIASRLLVELDDIPVAQIRSLLTWVSAQKVLMAEHARVAPSDALEYASRLRMEMPRVLEIAGPSFARSPDEILREFGASVDLSGFLFAATIPRIRGSDDFLALIHALDEICAADRNSFLDASAVIFDGLSVFTHSGWTHDQLEERDLKHTLICYELAQVVAKKWGRRDLMIDLACARSVIVDEGLSKAAEAIGIVDVAIEEYGRDPALIRQKSKVLGHYDRDMEAADLLISIEDEVSLESPFDRALALRDGGTSAARADRFADAARLFGKAHDVLSGIEAHRALAAGLLADKALALWSGGDRASALTSIADALDEVGNIDPSASRQNERAHHFARAVGGLFFHDLDAYPLGPRPIIAFGGASALSLDKEPLINVDLKPLSDNWRILALVEIETGCEVGIEQRSLAKQTEPGIASIELMICSARYGRTLTQGTIDEIIQAGITATSAAKAKLAHPEPMARIELAELVGTPAEAMLSDPNWRDAIFRIPADILLWQELQGWRSPKTVDALARACAIAFGGRQAVDNFFKAASGRYAVGSDAPFSFLTAAALARPQKKSASNPQSRFQRDLILVGHVSQSLARNVLEPLVVSTIVRGWTTVLESQRFALRAPAKNCPAIQKTIASMEKDGIRGAARLILAAAPAVAFELGADWEEHQTRSFAARRSWHDVWPINSQALHRADQKIEVAARQTRILVCIRRWTLKLAQGGGRHSGMPRAPGTSRDRSFHPGPESSGSEE